MPLLPPLWVSRQFDDFGSTRVLLLYRELFEIYIFAKFFRVLVYTIYPIFVVRSLTVVRGAFAGCVESFAGKLGKYINIVEKFF